MGALVVIFLIISAAFAGGRKVETFSRKRTYRRRMAKGFISNLGDEITYALLWVFGIGAAIVTVLALAGR